MKEFPEEAYSVAFHPAGLHILVGFADKLRIMNLLMDDIKTFKEFPIKSCPETQFSNGGQMFGGSTTVNLCIPLSISCSNDACIPTSPPAAVSGNTVQVFNTYTGEQLATLRAHKAQVTSLFWYKDDRQLLSCGQDGCVMRWDMRSKMKNGTFDPQGTEIQTTFEAAIATADGSTILASGRSEGSELAGNTLKVC